MSHRKSGLRALGLSFLAVLGLMAFMAAGASGNWLVELKELHTTEEVIIDNHGESLPILLVAAQKLEIDCHEIEGKDILLQPLSTLATGEVWFDECLTTQNGNAAPGCNPINQPIKAGGSAHLILHENHEYVEFRPNAGIFTLVQFNPKTCALVEDSEVTGSLVTECLSNALAATLGACLVDEKVHLLRERSVQFLGAGLFFGENPATIHGIASAAVDSGEDWSGHV
jgi:hypothetical protein